MRRRTVWRRSEEETMITTIERRRCFRSFLKVDYPVIFVLVLLYLAAMKKFVCSESTDPRDAAQIERWLRSLHLLVKIVLSLSRIGILHSYDETVDERCKYTIR